MLVDHTKERIYNAIIYFLKHTNKCGKTKLMKLFYEFDFELFKETGNSATGLVYKAWRKGPVPTKLWKKLTDNDPEIQPYLEVRTTVNKGKSFFVMKPKLKSQEKYFTRRELRILEKVAFTFKNANAQEMIKISHLKNRPWEKTLQEKGEGEIIDYFLALEEESPSKEDIIRNKNESDAIIKAFK